MDPELQENRSIASEKIRHAALCLTHDCNLRCTYCYAGVKSARRMADETAFKAVDFLADHSDGGCVVTFFGGEPLLEFDLMRRIVAYSRQSRSTAFEFRMSTNGTLINDAILAFLKDNGIFFSLSLDGTESQHNCTRRCADGNGSYDLATAQLDHILACNPYTIAVSVVVPETVDYLADGVIGLFHQGFRYVLQSLDYSAPWESTHIKEMKKQYQTLVKFYHDALAAGKKLYYSPFDERIKTWAQRPYRRQELCDLAASHIAIAASGRIYPCVQFVANDDMAEQANAIGDVFNGFNDPVRKYYIEQNRHDVASCAGCALDGRCATYCGCVNWKATGSLNKIPPVICEHERMLMPIVDKMANRLWSENIELFRRKFYDRAFPISSYIEDCQVQGRKADAADSSAQDL